MSLSLPARPVAVGPLAARLAGACLTLVATAVCAGPDYERDMQPILAEHCVHCHGLDEQTRQGGLRLDLRQHALAGGDSGEPAIVPGRPEESGLVARIHATDPDVVMPPPREQKSLSARQKELLAAWIAADAEYQPHWAFVPPRQAVVPAVPGADNPIDAGNRDVPYDQFVIEQIAGDLLPTPRRIRSWPPASSATACSTRRGRSFRRSSGWPRCSIGSTAWVRRCSV